MNKTFDETTTSYLEISPPPGTVLVSSKFKTLFVLSLKQSDEMMMMT